jgi:hypothetical protein
VIERGLPAAVFAEHPDTSRYVDGRILTAIGDRLPTCPACGAPVAVDYTPIEVPGSLRGERGNPGRVGAFEISYRTEEARRSLAVSCTLCEAPAQAMPIAIRHKSVADLWRDLWSTACVASDKFQSLTRPPINFAIRGALHEVAAWAAQHGDMIFFDGSTLATSCEQVWDHPGWSTQAFQLSWRRGVTMMPITGVTMPITGAFAVRGPGCRHRTWSDEARAPGPCDHDISIQYAGFRFGDGKEVWIYGAYPTQEDVHDLILQRTYGYLSAEEVAAMSSIRNTGSYGTGRGPILRSLQARGLVEGPTVSWDFPWVITAKGRHASVVTATEAPPNFKLPLQGGSP